MIKFFMLTYTTEHKSVMPVLGDNDQPILLMAKNEKELDEFYDKFIKDNQYQNSQFNFNWKRMIYQ